MSTIYEVAKLAKVSPKTAARILAGGSLRSKDRERVLGCARQLHYVRNQQAANLRTGRSRLIGLAVPFIDNPFYTKFLQEMHDALLGKGYQSLIACSFGRSEGMLAAIRLFESYNVDGIVLDLSEGMVTPEIREQIRRAEQLACPVVATGGQRPEVDCHHLVLDNRMAIGKVVRHLVARGHSAIGFLGGLPENTNIRGRLDGFAAALRDARLALKPEWISLGDPSLASVTQRAYQLLHAGRRRPTAVVCTSDMIAMTVIKTAVDGGLKVPAGLAVTGFDDIDQAALLNPGLTTIRQPLGVMAADTVNLLLSRPQSPRGAIQEKRYEAELVIREST